MPAEVKIEVKTRSKIDEAGEVEMHLAFIYHPRGSGHRRRVREMAAYIRSRPELAPWLKRMIVGTSRLTMVFRPGFGLVKALDAVAAAGRTGDVPGQLPLFAPGLAS